MKPRIVSKYFFILLIIFIWSVFTYVMFINKPNTIEFTSSNSAYSKLEDIKKLQLVINDLYSSNKQILNNVKDLVDQKEQMLSDKDTIKENNERLLAMPKMINEHEPVIPVIVMACNRITVKKCLDQLLLYRKDVERFPIIVSQDCNHEATRNVILNYGEQLVLIEQPDQSEIITPPKEKKFRGYFKISRHYGWALNQTFFKYNFKTAIIVEDDLDIAPDFYEYFLGLYPLLVTDPTLWCISAWNDNGKIGLINEEHPEKLYRTDFFPGLGWMLTKNLWTELAPKWPKSYWDDWIRKPEQRKDRACIRPEISRTKTFGKIGVSNGLFFEKHLKFIRLNKKFVPFTKLNLSYLLQSNYDKQFVNDEVYGAKEVTFNEIKQQKFDKFDLTSTKRITYQDNKEFKRFAKMLGLMDDFRSGVPRTAYKGIVTFANHDRYIHLAPSKNWKGYEIT